MRDRKRKREINFMNKDYRRQLQWEKTHLGASIHCPQLRARYSVAEKESHAWLQPSWRTQGEFSNMYGSSREAGQAASTLPNDSFVFLTHDSMILWQWACILFFFLSHSFSNLKAARVAEVPQALVCVLPALTITHPALTELRSLRYCLPSPNERSSEG